MFFSASFQSIVIYTGHKIQLTLIKTEESNALEPVCRALSCSCLQALPVHKYCVSCKSLRPAEEGRCGAFCWCYSPGHATPLPLYGSNSTEPCGFKGKEMGKQLCGWHGLVRIFFPFLLRKQLADSSSAPYKNGRAPFSPLPAGMSVSIFCEAAPCHGQKQCHGVVSFPWYSFTRLGTQLLVTFTASGKGMVHILCHGCLDVWLPSFSSCGSTEPWADSHHMYQGQCVQIAEY